MNLLKTLNSSLHNHIPKIFIIPPPNNDRFRVIISSITFPAYYSGSITTMQSFSKNISVWELLTANPNTMAVLLNYGKIFKKIRMIHCAFICKNIG